MVSKSVFNRQRPPRVVYVCGHKIKVKVVKELVDGSDSLHGAYNGDTKTIYLKKCKEWPTNFLHELIHCVLHLSGSSEGLSITKEEQLTLALEFGLGPLIFGK